MNIVKFTTDESRVELYNETLSIKDTYVGGSRSFTITDPEALKLIREGLTLEQKVLEGRK